MVLLFLYLEKIFRLIIPIILVPMWIHKLGQDTFGIYSQFLVLVSLTMPLIDLGIGYSLSRFWGKLSITRVFCWQVVFIVSIFVLSLFFYQPLSELLRQNLYKGLTGHDLFFFLLSVVFSGVFISKIGVLRAAGHLKAFGLLKLNDALLEVIPVGLVIWNKEFDFGLFLKGFVASKLISLVITSYFAWILLRKQQKAETWPESVGEFFRFALPTIPIIALSWLISGVDRIFIINHYSYHVLGFYSGVQTYLSKILLLLMVFTIVYPRIQTKWFDEKKFDLLSGSFRVYIQTKDLIFWCSFFLMLTLHEPFFNGFIGLEAEPSQQRLVMISLLGHFGYASLVQMNFIFYLSKKSNYILYGTSIAAGVNVIINYFFIDVSLLVPATATAISYAIAIVVAYFKNRVFVGETQLTGYWNFNQFVFPVVVVAYIAFEPILPIYFFMAATPIVGYRAICAFKNSKPTYLQIYNILRSY